ncbi:MAG: hypothetical protein K8T10_12150 [Candidatus Eremiobacteraeota bacterium]|nr:hypothetical protein [Candidatus Eremiobacteraeota bacterium]
MDYYNLVELKLQEAGVTLGDYDKQQLAEAYPDLLRWQKIAESLIEDETEPALTFKMKSGDDNE